MPTDPILHRLAAEFKTLRERQNLTQEALAHESDMNLRVLQGVENGKIDNRFSTLFKVAAGLKMPLSEIIAGVERRR